jgi:hypothetical protein
MVPRPCYPLPMRPLRWFLIGMTFIVMPDALAQLSLCTGPPLPSGATWIYFNPPAPNSAQPVAITVGLSSYIPVGTPPQVQLQGNVINVTFASNFTGFLPPPATCGTAFAGPLAQGVYTVNLYILDLTVAGPVPFLAGTTSLVVGAGPSVPATIPTNSVAGLAVLALLLSLAACHYVRMRSPPRRRAG